MSNTLGFADWLRNVEAKNNTPGYWPEEWTQEDKNNYVNNLADRYAKNPGDKNIKGGLSYQEYLKYQEANDQRPRTNSWYNSGYGGGSGTASGYSRLQAIKEAEARKRLERERAEKLAYYNDSLREMSGDLDRIDRAEKYRLENIGNTYARNTDNLGLMWRRTQEDHDADVARRLKTRQNRVNVADDDFKKQNDAYARYFARVGAGSSSVAQQTAPTLLARAAGRIRNKIEEDNAEEDYLQTINFNRAKEDYERNLAELDRQKAGQEQSTKSYYEGKRADYWNNYHQLEREKLAAENKDYNTVIAESRASKDKANRFADQAVDYGRLTEEMKYKPVFYQAVKETPWDYNEVKTKSSAGSGEETPEDDMYSKYFRDEEERKKREKENLLKI